MKIKIIRIDKTIPLPKYAYNDDAGMDLRSRTNVILTKNETRIIPTGIKIEIPKGYAGFIQPRSSLSKKGIHVSLGLVDSGYRGEVGIIITNLSDNLYGIKKGDRIAQLVIKKVENVEWDEVDELEESERNENGFGSTSK